MPQKKKRHILFKMIALYLLLGVFCAPFSFCAQASNPSVPEIISRAEWGADESKMNWPVEYARTEKFVIHHTASSNLVPDTDGSGEYKSMVNNIYIYHNSKKTWNDDDGEYTGFGDVGYNYLIDPNGNVYEGRFGGNGVIAGHANGYNTGSVGISVIGRYQDYLNSENEKVVSHPITSVIKESLENLIGWLAANNSIDLNKTSDFRGKNIDGVVGHKDLAPTICPGNELYKELSSIQSNASIIKKEYEKYAYQIGGDKAIYIIEDGYKTKYESKDKLPSAYKSRTIKPISKSQLDAYKYKNIVIYPDGSLLQEFNTAKVYYLENGQKRAMEMTGEEFGKMGFAPSDIKKVFASDLKIYENGKIIKYVPDGELLKDKNGNVFLTESGKKMKFTSAQLFEYLNHKWENIKEDPYLSFYLEGFNMVYPDGTLTKEGSGKTVYLIESKQRREITSENLMIVLGYSFADVVSITEDEFNHFPEGEKAKYPDNTLIKAEDFPAIYLVDNGKRKEFTSAQLFEKSGYEWKNIISTTKEEIRNYPLDGRVLYPDGLLVKSTNNPAIYLLESGKKRMVTSAVLFEKSGYDWADVISLSPSEMGEYQTGKILTYPNGILIKKEGFPAVYKIENGERKEFTSLALFEKTKSKWSDVIALNNEEFSAYPDGGNLKYPENALIKEEGDGKIYVIKSGKAEWIKTGEEFIKAGYRWTDVIEISKAEMELYISSKKEEVNEPVPDNPIPEIKKEVEENDETENINNENINANDNPNIRIAIYSSSGENVKITANGNYAVNYYNSDGTINKTESKSANSETTVEYFNSDSYMRFIPSSENVILKVLTYDDLSWNKAVNDNEFRGNIEINYSKTSQKLWIINELSLEDYVNGIAEALNDSPDEYLRSFGVIARTYAMYYIERGGKHSGEPFHLKNSRNGNGNDQVYKGYNFEMRAPKIVATNKFTVGYIINYNNKPIVAAYSSDSGGTTNNACDVLSKTYCGDDYVYLHGGVEDPENTQHDPAKISASHGAGMSAVGAYQMAIDGSSWQDIIKHYYPGVEIEKYY